MLVQKVTFNMSKHPQEKYLNLKTGNYEYFTFIGAHRYQHTNGTEINVMQLRRGYQFISTYKDVPTPPPHRKWEHNPATGFNVRKAYV